MVECSRRICSEGCGVILMQQCSKELSDSYMDFCGVTQEDLDTCWQIDVEMD